MSLVVGALAALSLFLALPPRRGVIGLAGADSEVGRGTVPAAGGSRRHLVWPVLAGLAGPVLVSGVGGLVLGVGVAVLVGRLLVRAESTAERRERAEVRRDLPVLVLLLAMSLRAGSSTDVAIRRVSAALPGAAAERLSTPGEELALGVDPERVWDRLADDPDLAPLGRALARAQRTGAPIAAVVERLADELAAAGRAQVEGRARAVGVRAAVPLGVCLLPAFLLLGIVPLVAGMVAGLQL